MISNTRDVLTFITTRRDKAKLEAGITTVMRGAVGS